MDSVFKEARRKELYSLLGDLPARDREITVKKVSEEEYKDMILERLLLDLNGFEVVPAVFVKPRNLKGKAPAVLYNHYHGGEYRVGKQEFFMGRNTPMIPSYAEELTKRGYCAICIDHWAFGERRGRSESSIFKEMLWKGQVMWGMMVYDSIRTLDYLVNRPEVDAERLGTVGLSMGSTMAWWVAALDARVKVCVDICCLTDFETLIESQELDLHGIYYYVPGLLKHFNTAQINSLIAPRAHLSIAGIYDQMTPPRGLDKIEAELNKVYAEENASEAWKMIRYNTGHMETADGHAQVLGFFEKWL